MMVSIIMLLELVLTIILVYSETTLAAFPYTLSTITNPSLIYTGDSNIVSFSIDKINIESRCNGFLQKSEIKKYKIFSKKYG